MYIFCIVKISRDIRKRRGIAFSIIPVPVESTVFPVAFQTKPAAFVRHRATMAAERRLREKQGERERERFIAFIVCNTLCTREGLTSSLRRIDMNYSLDENYILRGPCSREQLAQQQESSSTRLTIFVIRAV